MKEVEPDNKWQDENGPVKKEPESDGLDYRPGVIELLDANLVLLARLYDVSMAILSHIDKDEADALYDAHDRGELKNPGLWMPGEE